VRLFIASSAKVKCLEPSEVLEVNTNDLDFILVVKGYLKLIVIDIHTGERQTFGLEARMKVE
jgi:hypothetical protein